ncbi:MAG: hypothetical protein EWV75_06695 [Microcystis wesenbergii Mw_QC_S_20081001_S30D]|uniref:Uncharacterized protein n=1 Tax=Microcystis wesenbergii Mw_QC_S_20081001_S30D TaxID=2486245 RepID=A0A552JSE2_9CHRO|nr:MAG: hypothetical protein EWV75_06695 [Microcystis wesenbergii Mw_QC_S_20081001_S30D]TRV01355.1 MAG: hypothetical protein EWV73_09290 [Microcystis wesenbergii Mw_QC_B_20070930_S4D]TRV04070.1 MAG: hypothetical protein EWV74_05820 [Microcystis wesenbergii Mw_QC_S_20081001_S30]TRV15390.1 MAG: hypothetical protein EWV89_07405 [Microcystis wesenbergii Mw_QC_B_20070930_S4]
MRTRSAEKRLSCPSESVFFTELSYIQLSVINYQLSDVSFQFTVYCLLFTKKAPLLSYTF